MLLAAQPVSGTRYPPPVNKLCPLCGVTMFACTSEQEGRIRETFNCPRCGCVISSEPPDQPRDRNCENQPRP